MLIHSSPLKSRKRFTPDAFHTVALYFGLDDLTDTDCWAWDGSTCGCVFVTVSHQTRWKLSGGKSCLFLNKKIYSCQWCPWCLLTLVSLWEMWGCIHFVMFAGVCWWRCVLCYRTGSAHLVTYLVKGRRVGYPTHPPALCKVSCSCCRHCMPSWNSRHHRHTGTVSLLCLHVCLCLAGWLSLFLLEKGEENKD